jgi:hypothetical protein
LNCNCTIITAIVLVSLFADEGQSTDVKRKKVVDFLAMGSGTNPVQQHQQRMILSLIGSQWELGLLEKGMGVRGRTAASGTLLRE